MKEIADDQAAYIIKTGNLPDEILSSGEKVAIIFTQDWCPQWMIMKQWLGSMEKKGINTYYLVYNKKSYFNDFMKTKESVWKNDLIPYVRYYRDGKYKNDSNYVSKMSFNSFFE